MNVAVVGDVHGHLALMYAILGRWQRESGRRIDVILQVGDLGAFVESSTLDRATRRYLKDDPEELGFADFAGPSPPSTLLDPRPPLVFIPGNHEDFEFLSEREAAVDPGAAVYPVSEDGLMLGLRSGRIWNFEAEGAGGSEGGLRVAGVSGVAGRERKKHVHPWLYLDEEQALALAEAGPGAFDILISHECPEGVGGEGVRAGAGSPALRLLIDEVRPRFAFFGHYGWGSQWAMGRTQVIALSGCTYVRRGDWPLKRHGIALVEWEGRGPTAGGTSTVERLAPGWLAEATRGSWRRW